MVNPGAFDPAQSGSRLRAVHRHIRAVIPQLESGNRPDGHTQDAVISLFRVETDEWYQWLSDTAAARGANNRLLHGLQEGLNLIRVLVLDAFDGDAAAQRRLAVELRVRLQLEEDYLIPVLDGIANQTFQQTQDT